MFDSLTTWKNHKSYRSKIENVRWSEEDLQQLVWNETYMTDEIPADDNWNTFATKQKKQLEQLYQTWGVPKEGTLHYMCIRPKLTDSINNIVAQYHHTMFNYNFLKLTPGCQLTWHFDTYATFVKFHNISEEQASNVCRSAVMIKDWDCGQVFQIGNQVYTHWQAGDVFTWKSNTWHGVCNFGPSDIIIAQITFLDEDDKYTQ